MIRKFGETCYLALDHNRSNNPDSFECKFQMKQYSKNNKPKEDIFIRKCNFDIDSRGGLKLIFLDDEVCDVGCYLSLLRIIENDIDYTLLMSDVKEFIPIFAYQELPARLKMKHLKEDNIYLGADFFHSARIKDPLYMVLYNKYLKYKDKYVIWNGVVEKVKFSHIEIEDFDKDNIKVHKYKTYDEIPKEYKDRSNLDYIYEIIQE